MKLRSLVYITAPTIFFLAISSCKNEPDSTIKSDFYYFPEKNVYYDAQDTRYYYSLDDGKTWDSLTVNADNNGTALGQKVAMKRPDTFAWANNDADIKTYRGNQLNIINPATMMLAKKDSISKVKPVVVYKPITEEQPKPAAQEDNAPKGLKKVLNKLFGKKKRKTDK